MCFQIGSSCCWIITRPNQTYDNEKAFASCEYAVVCFEITSVKSAQCKINFSSNIKWADHKYYFSHHENFWKLRVWVGWLAELFLKHQFINIIKDWSTASPSWSPLSRNILCHATNVTQVLLSDIFHFDSKRYLKLFNSLTKEITIIYRIHG